MRRLYLVEQQNQAVLQRWRTSQLRIGASCQQPQQGVEDGVVLQHGLLRLADEHLEELQQRPLAVWVQATPQVPLDQTLQNVLGDHHVQYGAHGLRASATVRAVGGPLFGQQAQHLVGVVAHRREVVAGGRRLVLLQHPGHLKRNRYLGVLYFCVCL